MIVTIYILEFWKKIQLILLISFICIFLDFRIFTVQVVLTHSIWNCILHGGYIWNQYVKQKLNIVKIMIMINIALYDKRWDIPSLNKSHTTSFPCTVQRTVFWAEHKVLNVVDLHLRAMLCGGKKYNRLVGTEII